MTMTFASGKIQPGQEIGRCRVVREIGRGGMGSVYLASHKTLRTDVALKILSPELCEKNPSLADRFIREAQMAARIRHPNVVNVMDADKDDPTSLYYIIQEFMSGGTLGWQLRSGPMQEGKILTVLLGITQALMVADEAGIVHRDIKPDNILLDHRGTPKLADLGLAKHALDNRTSLTMGGAFMGTPAYMSPDQARDAKTVTVQDDIYSLGATAFECLTGRPPFQGDTPYNIMSQLLTSPTPKARDINPQASEPLSLICYKMMAKDRKLRYINAKALLDELEKVQRGSDKGWEHLLAAQLPDQTHQEVKLAEEEAKRLGVRLDQPQPAPVAVAPPQATSTTRPRRRRNPSPTRSVVRSNPEITGDSERRIFTTLLVLTVAATAFSISILLLGQNHVSGDVTPTPAPYEITPVPSVHPTHSHHPTSRPTSHPSPHPVPTEVPVPLETSPQPTLQPAPSPLAVEIPTSVPIPSALVPPDDSTNAVVLANAVAPTAAPSDQPIPSGTPIGSPSPALSPTPTPVSADSRPSAFAARIIASEKLQDSAAPLGRLLKVEGVRDKNSIYPTVWKFTFYDEIANQRTRMITVDHGVCTRDDQPMGLPLIGAGRDQILPDNEITIDSSRAIDTACAAYPNEKITSTYVSLLRKSGFATLLWEIELYKTASDGDLKHVATVSVQASGNGDLLTKK